MVSGIGSLLMESDWNEHWRSGKTIRTAGKDDPVL